MRIAFVSLNQELLPDPVVPIGLLHVLANTPGHHETMLWDLCFEKQPEAFLESKIREFQPDLIALGMRNIQNSDYSDYKTNLAQYKSVIDFLRTASSAPIILGGSGFSVMPKELMGHLRPDYGISGEAEAEFPRFLAALEKGDREFSGVGNFYFFRDGQLVHRPQLGDFLDLNGIRPPDISIADSRYFTGTGIGSVQTKRGCPLKCTYCTYPTVEGKSKRVRDPALIVDELEQAVSKQPLINHFFVVDSVFNLPKSHAKEVCREMIRRGFDVPWTCYINPLGFDDELAGLMAEAHCVGMEVGSDSGVDRVLALLRKGFTTQHIRELSRTAKRAGLQDCHTFILGTPGETLEDVAKTLEFVIDLDPAAAILGVWMDDYEALNPELAASRMLFRSQVKEVLRGLRDAYAHWVIPSLGVNFDPKFFSFLRRRKLTGPLWQHMRSSPLASSLPAPSGSIHV